MPRRVALISLLVRDYDEAIEFFTRALRFDLLEDTPMGGGKRWVRVAPGGAGAGGRVGGAAGGATGEVATDGPALLLARSSGDAQLAALGQQAGGRVFLFLHSDDIDADISHMQAHGVRFAEAPRDEPYGRVAVFFDLCGNPWDLIQPAGG